uniref:Uncharacterized protein n=1 Tax=Meloidogyne enterolobii TaxID=390850 RepID=A0A6V7WP92_MELEN|nr:unnamed protein product [Meloidogyne enterolobii]
MPNEEQGNNHYLKLNIDGHAMAILINNFGGEKGRCNLLDPAALIRMNSGIMTL